MQIVTFTLFHFEGFKNRWWAFSQMGKKPFQAKPEQGLRFAKMLGTGGGNGFSVRPNWGAYAWLGAWDTEGGAETFFQDTVLFADFKNHASHYTTYFLKPIKAQGYWDAQNPFQVQNTEGGASSSERPVAVLTRARIKWGRMFQFWQYVPRTSRSIEDYSERLLSIGIGELPLIEQATFSLWTSEKAMMDFAYKNRFHAEVVKKTRDLNWYSEELFARFDLIRVVQNH
jgi:hypothetical protein